MSNRQEVITFLEEMKEESGINKRFKKSANEVISLLQNNSLLAVEKAVSILEDVGSSDISSYHRTQVWEVVSMLESNSN